MRPDRVAAPAGALWSPPKELGAAVQHRVTSPHVLGSLRSTRSLATGFALAVSVIFLGCSASAPPESWPEQRPGDGSEGAPGAEASPSRPSASPDPQPPGGETGSFDPVIRDQIEGRARSLVGRPYRWGGGNPSGFDCSGFTSFVFAAVGIALPRTTVQQATVGSWVAPDELQAGDLVFFGSDRKAPFHVGLVVSDPTEPLAMIHASTSRGVIETKILTNSYWLSRLKFGRRAFEE